MAEYILWVILFIYLLFIYCVMYIASPKVYHVPRYL